jgi:hypothetical protein
MTGMPTTRTYAASIIIDSDWGEFKITSDGATVTLSSNPPPTTVLDNLDTIKWGEREGYEFDSVEIE